MELTKDEEAALKGEALELAYRILVATGEATILYYFYGPARVELCYLRFHDWQLVHT